MQNKNGFLLVQTTNISSSSPVYERKAPMDEISNIFAVMFAYIKINAYLCSRILENPEHSMT